MYAFWRFPLAALLLAAAPGGAHDVTAVAKTPPTPADGQVGQAAKGDTVWVLLNHVKADRRADFERFVTEYLHPAVEQDARTNAGDRKLLEHTHMLYPTHADKDGTYAYVWLMNPHISGVSYMYRDLLSHAYPAAKVQEALKLLSGTLARPQEAYTSVQSEW